MEKGEHAGKEHFIIFSHNVFVPLKKQSYHFDVFFLNLQIDSMDNSRFLSSNRDL